MAIYRPTRPRWRALALTGVIGLLVGGVTGWVIASAREDDPADAARAMRESLTGAQGALEVVDIEYAEAVEDGEVVSQPEYDGARDAALRSRSLYMDAADGLRVLAPEAAGEIDSRFEDLISAIDSTADEAEVSTIARETAGLLADFGAP